MKEEVYPEGDLLDINGAAEYLGVSSKTIRRYIKAGKIRARKVRNVWFCPRPELDKLIAVEAPPAPVAPEAAPAAAPVVQFDPAALIEPVLDQIKPFLEEFKGSMREVDRKLFLISQERENQHTRPDLIEKEQEIDFLKSDNQRLIEEIQLLKKELADLRLNGPKDIQILKNKVEEVDTLKATIASNERGLSLLRQEVRDRDEITRRNEQTIKELKERLRVAEEEAASHKSAKRIGLLGSRKARPFDPDRLAGSPE